MNIYMMNKESFLVNAIIFTWINVRLAISKDAFEK